MSVLSSMAGIHLMLAISACFVIMKILRMAKERLPFPLNFYISLLSSFSSIIVETGFYYIVDASQAHHHPASVLQVEGLQGLYLRKPSSSSVVTWEQKSAKLQKQGPFPYSWPMSSEAHCARTLRRQSQNSVAVKWPDSQLLISS